MLPPGLGFIALSDRAWEKTKQAKLPRFYFDLNLERKNQQKGSGAFTPAVSLIFGLRASFEHDRARRPRKRLCAPCAIMPGHPRRGHRTGSRNYWRPIAQAPRPPAFICPNGIDADEVLDYLRDKMNVTLAEGQDQLKGKAIRIAHVGYMGAFDVITGDRRSRDGAQKIRRRDSLRPRRRGGQEVLMEALA